MINHRKERPFLLNWQDKPSTVIYASSFEQAASKAEHRIAKELVQSGSTTPTSTLVSIQLY